MNWLGRLLWKWLLSPGVSSVQVLRQQPGDILIFSFEGWITQEQIVRFRAEWERAYAEPGTKVMVVNGNAVTVSIVRQEGVHGNLPGAGQDQHHI